MIRLGRRLKRARLGFGRQGEIRLCSLCRFDTGDVEIIGKRRRRRARVGGSGGRGYFLTPILGHSRFGYPTYEYQNQNDGHPGQRGHSTLIVPHDAPPLRKINSRSCCHDG